MTPATRTRRPNAHTFTRMSIARRHRSLFLKLAAAQALKDGGHHA
jgi:hypothetical protein